MGYGAPGDDGCEALGSYECQLPPLPDGLDSRINPRTFPTGVFKYRNLEEAQGHRDR